MADIISNIGNEKANAYWEFNLPEGRKPGPNDTTYALESFIKDKYVNKRFVKKGAEPPTGKPGKKSKTKKEPEPKKVESEDEEVSSEEEVEQPKKQPKKTKKTQESKATKKPSPKVTISEETKPKETKPKKETNPTEPAKEDDILTFNNWAETIPTGTDDFGSFFSPEPVPTPTPTPTPAAPAAKPTPDIMSLFKTPQPSFQNPYPQIGPQMGYGYPPYSQPYVAPSYVPAHIAAGGPMGSATTPRRKVNSTNDVMALF